MTKYCSYRILILLFIGLNYSCFSNKYEYIGEKKVVNKEDWKVRFYQLDEFEMFTPVEYEIINKNDNRIFERHYLSGADANLQNADKFYTKILDSIFYICYPYLKVESIKHISNLNSPNQWDLLSKLRKSDPLLYRRK